MGRHTFITISLFLLAFLFSGCTQTTGPKTDKSRNGYGVYTYKNGDVYKGYFKNGFRYGHGTYFYKNGSKYKGAWDKGLKEGYGRMDWSEKSSYGKTTYRGIWSKDSITGRGDFINEQGMRYAGVWRSAKIVSSEKVAVYKADSSVYGYFEGDIKNGISPTGKVKVVFKKPIKVFAEGKTYRLPKWAFYIGYVDEALNPKGEGILFSYDKRYAFKGIWPSSKGNKSITVTHMNGNEKVEKEIELVLLNEKEKELKREMQRQKRALQEQMKKEQRERSSKTEAEIKAELDSMPAEQNSWVGDIKEGIDSAKNEVLKQQKYTHKHNMEILKAKRRAQVIKKQKEFEKSLQELEKRQKALEKEHTQTKQIVKKSMPEALAYCWKNKSGFWFCDGPIQKTSTGEKELAVNLKRVGCEDYRKTHAFKEGKLFYCGYSLKDADTGKRTHNRDIRKWHNIAR